MNNFPGRRPDLRQPWPRRARVAAVIPVMAAVALTAACSGSPSSASPHDSPNAGGPASPPSGLAFSRCMRSHGVQNFPDPPPSFNGKFPGSSPQQLGVSASQIQAATGSCQSLLPSVPGQAPITAHDQQDYLKAAACMRSHGIINFPDPVFSGGTVSLPIPSSVDTGSPQFTQARQTCEKLIPAGLPYSGSGAG
jgi:hypothetical protein